MKKNEEEEEYVNFMDVDTFPAVVNMEWCYGRSNTEKESLKELTLTLTPTLTIVVSTGIYHIQ